MQEENDADSDEEDAAIFEMAMKSAKVALDNIEEGWHQLILNWTRQLLQQWHSPDYLTEPVVFSKLVWRYVKFECSVNQPNITLTPCQRKTKSLLRTTLFQPARETLPLYDSSVLILSVSFKMINNCVIKL